VIPAAADRFDLIERMITSLAQGDPFPEVPVFNDDPELEAIVATLRKHAYEVGAHDELKTAPKGYPKDHPRIELLRYKGIVMSKSWPVGAWLGTKKAKERVVTCLEAARPLNAWIERAVGVA